MNNQVKTILLLGVLTAILISFGGSLGQGYFMTSIIMALVMNLGAYYFSDKMVLAMSGAKEVSAQEAPQLHRIVEDLAMRAGLPKPKICLLPSAQPNAFATGRTPEKGVVAVSSGIMQLLNERELRGVIAHELGHIKHRDILIASIAAMMAAAISSLSHMAQFAAMFGSSSRDNDSRSNSGLETIVFALVAPLAAVLVQMGISRSREYLADAYSAKITQDPEALMSALAKLQRGAETIPSNAVPATASLYIVNPFAGVGGVMSLFSTHPSMEKRIAKLQELQRNPILLQQVQ